MKGFSDDIRSETKKGNYQNVAILVLCTIVFIAIPALWYQYTKKIDRNENLSTQNSKEIAAAVKEARAEARADCADEIRQLREDNSELKKNFANLSEEFNAFRDKYIAGLENNSGRSASIVRKSKKVISEIQQQKSEVKELNEDINSLSKTLTQ